MKQNQIIHLLVSVVFTLACTGTGMAQSLFPKGDVNRDSEVSVADLTNLVDILLKNSCPESQQKYADVNKDGEITVADVALLASRLMGFHEPAEYCYSGTLPVVYLMCEGTINKSDYLPATMRIDALGLEPWVDMVDSQLSIPLSIKGRGNYTWSHYAKKPYKIKLDKKNSLLGFSNSKHFALVPHADDWMGYVRDEAGYELSRRIGMEYSPRQVPIELVINDEYQGLYFLSETVRVEKNRVNITEQDDMETDPQRVTGGWLLEIDNYNSPGQICIMENDSVTLLVTSHSPEELSEQQRQYLTCLITETDSAIYNPDKTSTDWEDYIDMDALAKFYIVNEVLEEVEAFHGSCYFYKDKGDSAKLKFGPIWDCGNSYTYDRFETNMDAFLVDYPKFQHHWIAEILKYPRFQEYVRELWKTFRPQLDTMDEFIDSFVDQIAAAAASDEHYWPSSESDYIRARANAFKTCLHKKIVFLDSQWGVPNE